MYFIWGDVVFFSMVHDLSGGGFLEEAFIRFANLNVAMSVYLFVINGFTEDELPDKRPSGKYGVVPDCEAENVS